PSAPTTVPRAASLPLTRSRAVLFAGAATTSTNAASTSLPLFKGGDAGCARTAAGAASAAATIQQTVERYRISASVGVAVSRWVIGSAPLAGQDQFAGDLFLAALHLDGQFVAGALAADGGEEVAVGAQRLAVEGDELVALLQPGLVGGA